MPWSLVAKPSAGTYTNVAKPAVVATIRVGAYMGPLGLTYSNRILITNWVNVSKPAVVAWTNVAKPT